MRTRKLFSDRPPDCGHGFSMPDLLVLLAVIAVLTAVLVPVLVKSSAKSRQTRCLSNLQQITRAVLLYAGDNKEILPANSTNVWWYYKEMVKGYAGLSGPPSARDTLFACPNDRGYTEPQPFYSTKKFFYGSYVFNGVSLPVAPLPNIAGMKVSSVKEPSQTLLVMEWTAHAPLSWHKSKTGKMNQPFYNDAENMVGYVDGRVKFIKIYYDGMNAAFTRDPIPGYEYRYSGD